MIKFFFERFDTKHWKTQNQRDKKNSTFIALIHNKITKKQKLFGDRTNSLSNEMSSLGAQEVFTTLVW